MFLDFVSNFFFAFPSCDISPIFRNLSSKLYFLLSYSNPPILPCLVWFIYYSLFASMPNSLIITYLLLCPVAHKGPQFFPNFLFTLQSSTTSLLLAIFSFSQISLFISSTLVLENSSSLLLGTPPISLAPARELQSKPAPTNTPCRMYPMCG